MLCTALLCLKCRDEVTLSSDHMNHLCVSLLVPLYGVIYVFAHTAAEELLNMSRTSFDI